MPPLKNSTSVSLRHSSGIKDSYLTEQEDAEFGPDASSILSCRQFVHNLAVPLPPYFG